SETHYTCFWFCSFQVPDILGIIYIRLPTVQQVSLRQFLMEAVCILAHHHLEAVISSLLSKQLPMDSDTAELWRSLEFSIAAIEREEGVMVLRETSFFPVLSFQATCALFEVVSALQSRTAVQKLLPELFVILLQQVSRTLEEEMPLPRMSSRRRLFRKGPQLCVGNPCRLSIEALDAVLSKGVSERLMGTLRNQRTWILLENPETHHEGVCLLVRTLLLFSVLKNILGLTDMLIAFQLMRDPLLRDKKFLKSVLGVLEAKSRDSNSIVCQMAVRGLGNIVYGAPEKVKKHKKFLLGALIRASNNSFSPEVVGESMKALAKILKELKEKDIGSTFRDLTTLEDDGVRSQAFVLYGILARSAQKKWKTYFTGQVRESWVTLVLHLQDSNPKASRVRNIVTYLLTKRNLFPSASPTCCGGPNSPFSSLPSCGVSSSQGAPSAATPASPEPRIGHGSDPNRNIFLSASAGQAYTQNRGKAMTRPGEASCINISVPKRLPGSVDILPLSHSFLHAFWPGFLTGESLVLLEQISNEGDQLCLNEHMAW
uniref:Uncharacterized protein n=1 Tax=Pelusios castaneus TaxID=367368 RepID=A0A8C8SAM1_9SAUR